MTAAEVIDRLDLRPHPEGGHYTETYRATTGAGGRPSSTAIYYLLQSGETSHWHRVDAAEVWHYYAGAPLVLSISQDGHHVDVHHLGADLTGGERPQVVVPAGSWQSARTSGHWTLVGCTVAPGFLFEGFELAPPHWRPGRG